VDPDNRRPVDFAERAAVLASLGTPEWASLAQRWTDGHLKLAWTAHLLKLRTGLAEVFTHGDYEPLKVSGPHRDHIVAFSRRSGADAAIVVVARHFAAFSEGGRAWPRGEDFEGAIDLAGYSIAGIETAAELPLSSFFTHLPVAVLQAKPVAATKPARRRVVVP
jgi:(1->4)-alpha-D-glucan 1-alpha-D-glucosylmutase